jgi:hypothetical protein
LLSACVRAEVAPAAPAAVSSPGPADTEAEDAPIPLRCPAGTTTLGGSPPEYFRLWCERSDGLPHGPLHAWYDGGQPEVVGSYEGGAPHGPWQSWYESGARRSKGRWDHGRPIGVWILWHANGQESVRIEHDGNEATYRSWHADGSPWREGHLLDGREVGTWREWDPAMGAFVEVETPLTLNLAEIGVPECDAYVADYARCIRERLPAAVGTEVEQALGVSAVAWRNASRRAADRESLAEACRIAHATARRSLEPLGCRFAPRSSPDQPHDASTPPLTERPEATE